MYLFIYKVSIYKCTLNCSQVHHMWVSYCAIEWLEIFFFGGGGFTLLWWLAPNGNGQGAESRQELLITSRAVLGTYECFYQWPKIAAPNFPPWASQKGSERSDAPAKPAVPVATNTARRPAAATRHRRAGDGARSRRKLSCTKWAKPKTSRCFLPRISLD